MKISKNTAVNDPALLFAGEAPGPGNLFIIESDGSFRVAAKGLSLPNGAVITPDGRHFVVAESFAGKLTHFDRAANGDLSNPRCYAELPERVPDGICLDVDGNIRVAEFGAGQFSLIDTRGEMIAIVVVRPHAAVACQLGGTDGRTLYCLVYPGQIPDIAASNQRWPHRCRAGHSARRGLTLVAFEIRVRRMFSATRFSRQRARPHPRSDSY